MRTRFRAGSLLPLMVLPGCGFGSDSPAGPLDPPIAPVVVVAIAGDQQLAKAGDVLPRALVVRVTEPGGAAVAGAEVVWRVVEGKGQILEPSPTSYSRIAATRTRVDGTTEVRFRPVRLGRTQVRAMVAGRRGDSVTFTTDARVLVFHNEYWGIFLAPNDSTTVTVPRATEVEWVNRMDRDVVIRSTSVPPGGAPFSARLRRDERLRFMPGVSGSWEWVYQYMEPWGEVAGAAGTGELTVL